MQTKIDKYFFGKTRVIHEGCFLSGEFENQIKKITDSETAQKIIDLVTEAGQEFPCLTCPSNVECGSFKWFKKWFGKTNTEP